jgi:hypothetical protein
LRSKSKKQNLWPNAADRRPPHEEERYDEIVIKTSIPMFEGPSHHQVDPDQVNAEIRGGISSSSMDAIMG